APIRREASQRDPGQVLIRVAVEPGPCAGEVGAGRGHQGRVLAARVRGLAREDLAEDRTEAEDVGTLVELVDLPSGLLRGHVGQSPADRTVPRLPCGPAIAPGAEGTPQVAGIRFVRCWGSLAPG